MSVSLSVPILMLEPPTPIPLASSPSRRSSDMFGSALPVPLYDSLEVLNPSSFPLFEDDKIDYNLLSPPGPRCRRRRSLRRVKTISPSKPPSFVGLSLLGIAAIVLLTTIAALSSPASSLNHTGGTGLFSRFRGKMHVALALEVQGGAMLRDMTLGDIWTQVTHRQKAVSSATGADETRTSGTGQLRAMSNDAWVEYREKRAGPAAALDLWDFH